MSDIQRLSSEPYDPDNLIDSAKRSYKYHVLGNMDDIRSLPRSRNVETEVRFGRYYRDRFEPGINRSAYDRVYKVLLTRSPTFTEMVDYRWDNGVRKRADLKDSKLVNVRWEVKSKESQISLEIRPFGIRINSSVEKPTDPIKGKWGMLREIKRVTVEGDGFLIELSSVYNSPRNAKPYRSYELEFEIKDFSKLKALEATAYDFYRLVYDTRCSYTIQEVEAVNYQINYMLSKGKFINDEESRSRSYIMRHYLNDARNLHRHDIVDDGLIGNKDRYRVTDKADGHRKLLTFNETGIWLVGTNSHDLIRRGDFGKYNQWLVEGELIPKENLISPIPDRYQTKYVYMVYDVISNVNVGMGLQDMNHSERMRDVGVLEDFFSESDLIYLKAKDFITLSYGGVNGDAFQVISATLDTENGYKTDGLMFVPDGAPYDPWRNYKINMLSESTQSVKGKHDTRKENVNILPRLRDRVLTKNHDICKWKPGEEMTVDLAVVVGNDVVKLYSGMFKKNIPFNGTNIYPLDWSQGLDPEHELLKPNGVKLPSHTVVECRFVRKRDRGGSPYKLEPVRVRYDKFRPNQDDVARDNWDMAHRPISEKTMRGRSDELMRAYHNEIKSNLYRRIPEGSTILDIGSGRGGDVNKWKDFNYIYAVEPNVDHIRILEKRIRKAELEDYVSIINAPAENVDLIIDTVLENGQVDAVTFMLSLTFFWESEDSLRSIAYIISKVLKPGGIILFLTMDGDVVTNYFRPPGEERRQPLNSDAFYLELKDDDSVYIDIKDSIVSKQTEYLSYPYDLAYLVQGKMSKLRTDKRMSLNKDEKILCNMYSYGEIIVTNNVDLTKPHGLLKEKMTTFVENTKPVEVAMASMGLIKTALEYGDLEPIKINSDTMGFRLGAIGGHNNLIHAYLQSFSKHYESKKKVSKVLYAQLLRRAICEFMFDESRSYSDWLIMHDGYYSNKYTTQLIELEKVCAARMENPDGGFVHSIDSTKRDIVKDDRDYRITEDWSEAGVNYRLMSSEASLPDIFPYTLAGYLGVDIYLFKIMNGGMEFVMTTAIEGDNKPVCILGLCAKDAQHRSNPTHYETIGVEQIDDDGSRYLRTIFYPNDPIISGYKRNETGYTETKSPDAADNPVYLTFMKSGINKQARAIKSLNPRDNNLSMFNYMRPYFTHSYGRMISGIMTALKVPVELWPPYQLNTYVEDGVVFFDKEDTAETILPICFSSQNAVRTHLGIDLYSSRLELPPLSSLSTPPPLSKPVNRVSMLNTPKSGDSPNKYDPLNLSSMNSKTPGFGMGNTSPVQTQMGMGSPRLDHKPSLPTIGKASRILLSPPTTK